MSYHGIGAGPGPGETYYVDMPFPWGDNTAVTVPLRAMINDVVRSIEVSNVARLVPWDSINTRVRVSLPVWIEQANELAEPHIDRYVNKALVKFAVVSALLMGGAFVAAKKFK